jgi:hypothetical protein
MQPSFPFNLVNLNQTYVEREGNERTIATYINTDITHKHIFEHNKW